MHEADVQAVDVLEVSSIESPGARRIRHEVPNWILTRLARISGQIVLEKERLSSSLAQIMRPAQ